MSDSKDGVSRALGVEFYSSGQLFSASVRREVILSAGQSSNHIQRVTSSFLLTGALQTPQLLELSGGWRGVVAWTASNGVTGIGKPKILQQLGIPLKVDLPGVGENFQVDRCHSLSSTINFSPQDHFVVTLGAELFGHHITVDDLSSERFSQERLQEYRETRRGMFSSTLSTLVFIPASTFIPADKMKHMLAALDGALQAPEIKNSPYKQWYDLQRAWLENDGVAQLEIILFPCTSVSNTHVLASAFGMTPL